MTTQSNPTEEKKIKLLTEEELIKLWPNMSREERDEACLYQNISVEFCKDHEDEINWPNLSVNPNLTFGHLDKFPNRISWKSICINGKMITDTFLYNYRLRVQWDIVLARMQLDDRLLVFLGEAFRKSSKMQEKMAFWKALSRYQNMPLTFVKVYKRYIDMKELSKNPNTPIEVIESYLEEMDPEALLNRDLPKEFFIKHAEFFKSAESVKRAMNELQQNG